MKRDETEDNQPCSDYHQNLSSSELAMIGDGPETSFEQNDSEEKLPQKRQVDPDQLLKPADIKRIARVPYETVIKWITVGHPRAGILPSIDLAETGKRHSYRIRRADWGEFQAKLQTRPRTRRYSPPAPRPQQLHDAKRDSGMFRY